MSAPFTIMFLYGMGLTASIQVGMIGPIATPLRVGFDLSQAQFGLVASLITAAGALFAIPAGVWAARFGLKQSVIAGGILMIAGGILFASANTLSLLYIGRLVTSAGYLLVVVGAPSWMTRLENPRMVAIAMGIWGTFVPVGIALGTWISAALTASIGWRAAVGGCTLPVLFFLIAIILIARPQRSLAHSSFVAGAIGVLSSRNALGVALTFGIFAGATSASIAFMPTMLVARLGIDLSLAATLIGVATIAGNVLGSVMEGILVGAGPKSRFLLLLGLGTMAVAIAVLYQSTTLGVALACLAAFNTAQGLVSGTCFSLLPGIAGRHLSMPALQGMLAQFAEIFVVLVPPGTGAMIDLGGWPGAAATLGLLYLCATIIGFFLVRPGTIDARQDHRQARRSDKTISDNLRG